MDTCDKSYDIFVECSWNRWLWRTIPIVQLLFGTLGNIMNITILLRKRLRKYSTTVYITALAFSDLCCLWSTLFQGLFVQGFGKNLRADSQFICKVIDWIGYTFGGYSIWLLAFITFERVMLIRYPAFSRLRFTRRSAVITTLSCLVVTAGSYCQIPFEFDIQHITTLDSENITVTKKICAISNSDYKAFYKNTFILVYSFFYTALPVMLIIIANIVIIVSLCVQRRRLCAVNPTGQVHKSNAEKKTKSSTKMVILMSAFFVFTRFPYSLKKSFEPKTAQNDKELVQSALIDSVLVFVIYCNLTFNFLLYCTSSSIYKEELRAFVANCRKQIFKVDSGTAVKEMTVSKVNVTVSATDRTAVF